MGKGALRRTYSNSVFSSGDADSDFMSGADDVDVDEALN